MVATSPDLKEPPSAAMVNYVHLRISTEYSVACSTIRIDTLLQQCAQIGLPAASITDQASMFGTIRFFEGAQKSGIKGIIGCVVPLLEAGSDAQTEVLLLCKNTRGYKNLIKIVSEAYSASNAETGCVDKATVLAHSDGLIALSGAMRGDVGQSLLANDPEGAQQLAAQWQSAFGDNYFLELQRVGHADEEKYIAGALELAIELNLPVVATNAVMFLQEADYEAHEIRCAIASKSIYNSNFDSGYTEEQYLKTPEAMCELFADLPSALANSVNIAIQCTLDIELGNHQLPQFPYPEGHTLDSYFEERARQGLDARLVQLFPEGCSDDTRKIYSDRLEYELSVITRMEFSGYFLIVADFIVWSKENGIPVGPGRGSGTGSLVAYSLLISEMDPIEYELLFERFLNPERVALPDFDIDFCIDGREKTIEYVREKYGKDSVSQIATFGTMAAKAVVKDVTRALDRPYGLGEKLARAIGNDLGVKLSDCMAEGQELLELYHQDEDVRIIVDYALPLEGLVRSIGKHAGGVVISPTLTTDFTPIYRENQTAAAITQYDKKDVELAGLVKFDFLGLKNLTIIKNTFSNMRLLHQDESNPALIQHENDIPLDDDKTYEMLRQGKTASVFQLESAGMTDLVVRLGPRKFDDLIPLVALYRPGPLQAGIVDDFIDRRGGKQKVSFPHTDLESTLAATYGVIIFQEQIMHIGRTIAGYTMGMADELRSAVAKKKPVEMAKHKTGFAERADERGYDKTMVQDLFNTIEVFASYCFPKAHSATYAWLAYQTAYLKANHPSSYMAAVLTADMGLTDKAHIAFTESTNMGVSTLPAHINHSQWIYLPTSDSTIRMGLGAIKGVQQQFCLEIIKERNANGNFSSLADLTQRLPTEVQKATLENLVRVGAADNFGETREEMLEQLPYLLGEAKRYAQESDAGQFSLLDEPPVIATAALAPEPTSDPTTPVTIATEMLFHEKRLTGLFMTEHPTSRYRELLKGVKFKSIASLDPKKTESNAAVLCTVNASRKKFTRSGKPFFQLQVEDDSGAMEVPLFEDNSMNPNNLKFGQILVLLLEYKKARFGQRDAAPKLNVKSAVSLDEFIAQSTKLIKLKVNSTRLCGETFADALTQLLSGANPGFARIRITYQNQNAQADILLRKYRIAANLTILEQLQTLSNHKIEISADINALRIEEDFSAMLPPPELIDSVADVH